MPTFDADALRFSGELAKQAAIAIENARLLREAERHAREQTAPLKVSQAVRTAPYPYHLGIIVLPHFPACRGAAMR